MLGFLLASLIFVPGAGCSVTSADDIVLDEAYVRIRDLVTMDCLTPASVEEVGDIPVTRLTEPAWTADLSRADVQHLVRRRIPALGRRLIEPVGGVVRLSYRSQVDKGSVPDAGCFEAQVAIAAGEVVEKQDVQSVACELSKAPVGLRYDRRAGSLRAEQSLTPGTYLGKLHFGAGLLAQSGEEILLCASAGPVTVERKVEALQPVAIGQAAFVRGSDGRAFATTSFCQGKG